GHVDEVDVDLRRVEAVDAGLRRHHFGGNRARLLPRARGRVVGRQASLAVPAGDHDDAIVRGVVVGQAVVGGRETAGVLAVRRVGPGVRLRVVDVDVAFVGPRGGGVVAPAEVEPV